MRILYAGRAGSKICLSGLRDEDRLSLCKKGRVILAHKKHVSELIDLTDEERNDFFAEVAQVARAVHKVFHPDKVNYGAYGDTGCHLHFHIVPKYKGGEEWGGTFEMNSGRTILTDAEYEEMAEALRQALKEV